MPNQPDQPRDGSRYWQQNLYVCLFGSFTTLCAMTVFLPFLPLYVEQLGVKSQAAIVQWSGIAFGSTFFAAGLVAPLWGRLADIYGRKVILIRASLGMAITMSLIGLAQNVYELVALRLLAGLAGGYSSGSTVLVATQTPRARAGWALGVLSTGIMGGTLLGPLIGGFLPDLVGLRATFFLCGGFIFVAFLGTCFLIREDKADAARRKSRLRGGAWGQIPDRLPVFVMLATGMLLMLANMSIEPIITVYVAEIDPGDPHIARMAGLVMSATALGSILAASRVGRLGDRIGPGNVVAGGLAVTGLLLIPQAFVTSGWQLVALRFLMGISLAGLLPSIASLIRRSVPDHVAGNILGYSVSAQFAGQVIGPLLGGFVGGHVGMRAVFFVTSTIMFSGAALNFFTLGRRGRRSAA
jgi:MFS family permease